MLSYDLFRLRNWRIFLRDGDAETRLERKIAAYGKSAIDPLIDILRSGSADPISQRYAAAILAEIDNDIAAYPLFGCIARQSLVSEAAHDALFKMQSPLAREAQREVAEWLRAEARSVLALVCSPGRSSPDARFTRVDSVVISPTPHMPLSLFLPLRAVNANQSVGVRCRPHAEPMFVSTGAVPRVLMNTGRPSSSHREIYSNLQGYDIDLERPITAPFLITGDDRCVLRRGRIVVQMAVQTWGEVATVAAYAGSSTPDSYRSPRGNAASYDIWGFMKSQVQEVASWLVSVGDKLPCYILFDGEEVYGCLHLAEETQKSTFEAELYLSRDIPVRAKDALYQKMTWTNRLFHQATVKLGEIVHADDSDSAHT